MTRRYMQQVGSFNRRGMKQQTICKWRMLCKNTTSTWRGYRKHTLLSQKSLMVREPIPSTAHERKDPSWENMKSIFAAVSNRLCMVKIFLEVKREHPLDLCLRPHTSGQRKTSRNFWWILGKKESLINSVSNRSTLMISENFNAKTDSGWYMNKANMDT